MPEIRRVVPTALTALALAATLTLPVASAPADAARTTTRVGAPAPSAFRQLTSDADWAAGTLNGTRAADGSLRIAGPTTPRRYAGARYAQAGWTSGWQDPGQGFTQLIPSWSALTPPGTWVEVLARARTSSAQVSGWKVMGRWSTRDARFHRTSAGSQADALARVDTDTFSARNGVTFSNYQLRVKLLRPAGSRRSPTLRSLDAVVATPAATTPPTSTPLMGAQQLAVPAYSQMIHRGQYPGYGGGGEAWCSPTSLAMVLGYYGRLPAPASYAWVSGSYADRWVDQAARLTYDYGYAGTGNWPFNTAVAALFAQDAFVTKLGDLRDAERFVAAGIPLVASISFSRGGLTGAPIHATAGHLVVVSGFTATGDVVVDDPAAPTDASVRRTYDRGQFERAWLGRSGGLVYVVRDGGRALPDRAGGTRW